MSPFLFKNILINCNILKTVNMLHINGILFLRVSPHSFSVPVSRISFCVTFQPTHFTSLIFWYHILSPVSSIMNQFFILSVQDWHKYSKTFLLHLVWKHLGSLTFSDYFIHWFAEAFMLWIKYSEMQIRQGGQFMNYQVHKSNTGVIPHIAFEKILFSDQEWCVALWEQAKETCVSRFFCVTKKLMRWSKTSDYSVQEHWMCP